MHWQHAPPTQHAPLTDDTEVHHATDTEEKLLSSQRQTALADIDAHCQSQLQNWNFHTVRNKIIVESLMYTAICLVDYYAWY